MTEFPFEAQAMTGFVGYELQGWDEPWGRQVRFYNGGCDHYIDLNIDGLSQFDRGMSKELEAKTCDMLVTLFEGLGCQWRGCRK
jgi:hypothetical protein